MKRKKSTTILCYVCLCILSLLALFPYLWMVLGSFKTRLDNFSIPPKWIFEPTTTNYTEAFISKGFLRSLGNSAIVAVASTLISLLVGVPGAYGLSSRKLRGDSILMMVTLVMRMAPPVIIAIPFYILIIKLRLSDTLVGVILAHVVFTLPLVTWMMKSFFDTLPREVEEAAIVDGCSPIGVFFRIALPLVEGGLAATAILSIITSWNEFLLASVLTGYQTRTLPVAIPSLITSRGTFWGEICAVGAVVSIPVVIFTFIVQKHLVSGMTMGAIK
jgi:multiple sugar transport system permease protein